MRYYSRDPVELRKYLESKNKSVSNKRRNISMFITLINLFILFLMFSYLTNKKGQKTNPAQETIKHSGSTIHE